MGGCIKDRIAEAEKKDEEEKERRRKEEEEKTMKTMMSDVRVDPPSNSKMKSQLEALEASLQHLPAEDREVTKLAATVKELHVVLEQPTIASLRESCEVMEKAKRRVRRATERIAREKRERRRREVKAEVKAVSALYAEYEAKCERGGRGQWR